MSFDGIEIGALWTGKGKALYTGKLGAARVIVLENRGKKTDKHPDARIFVVPDDRRQERGGDDDRGGGDYGGYGG